MKNFVSTSGAGTEDVVRSALGSTPAGLSSTGTVVAMILCYIALVLWFEVTPRRYMHTRWCCRRIWRSMSLSARATRCPHPRHWNDGSPRLDHQPRCGAWIGNCTTSKTRRSSLPREADLMMSLAIGASSEARHLPSCLSRGPHRAGVRTALA